MSKRINKGNVITLLNYVVFYLIFVVINGMWNLLVWLYVFVNGICLLGIKYGIGRELGLGYN